MMRCKLTLSLLLLGCVGLEAQLPSEPTPVIAWDATVKEQEVQVGDREAHFVFHLTNTAPSEVVIKNVRTSCGCTIAKLPDTPWTLTSGEAGEIGVTMNLLGRVGTVTKSIFVDTSVGMNVLNIRVKIPGGEGRQITGLTERQRNQLIALRDRQAVFRGKCADCHAKPAGNKTGRDLYEAVCAICHAPEHRASMVPDLKALGHPTSLEYWETWISHGQAGTLMPAFLKSQGGPLTPEQIRSLAEFLEDTINGAPKPVPIIIPIEDPLFTPVFPK